MDPKILCLGIYPKDIKNDYKHSYMELIFTALPITVKSGNDLNIQRWETN